MLICKPVSPEKYWISPGMSKKKVLFHQDKAPAHTSAVAMVKLHELQFELLDHPPSPSPDFVPSDFYLIPNLKKQAIAATAVFE